MSTENTRRGLGAPKRTRHFWLYFVAGALLLCLGICLLPVWGKTSVPWRTLGQDLLSIIMFLLLSLYIGLYLCRLAYRERNRTIGTLIIVEIVVFSFIALGCILEQFHLLNVGGPCTILGAAIWFRGLVLAIKAFLRRTGERDAFSLLLIAIALVTLGAVLMAKPLFTELTLLWIVATVVLALSLLLFVYGFLAKPEKRAQKA